MEYRAAVLQRQPRYLRSLGSFRPEALRPRLSTGLLFRGAINTSDMSTVQTVADSAHLQSQTVIGAPRENFYAVNRLIKF